MATLNRYVDPDAKGHFYLVGIEPTKPRTFEEQRIIVRVVDENGFPMAGQRVAFSYSTADQYILTPDFLWSPPPPPKAFIVPTGGGGEIDQIQGSAVQAGQPGGVTVYLLEPEYSSDVVTGLGMLADHTGLRLTFQLRRNGVVPLVKWQAGIEIDIAALLANQAALEARVEALEGR